MSEDEMIQNILDTLYGDGKLKRVDAIDILIRSLCVISTYSIPNDKLSKVRESVVAYLDVELKDYIKQRSLEDEE